ncbi:hypothetical protein [Ligilactobacillus pobuzihii]|uniref:Lipoprotein n=1 Tax=Ligilactobacillus pobuzihii TaxID=449659 RepID=A0A0R2LLD2_9LACO|nr:hypothetical protein [Ligilactobacillus pobuzihii]KRK10923.1 hypothetical protein FD11_GL001192 [Ligilactobacillus pobuzihii E100301 = KCTC 13174]KRN99469.1 hypothetical protein IV66_GL001472 [Ligilactobacillus pobuzihii]GEN48905.1 hypothetical protein LPO01_16970 [Ligilactobacillus pobuzihii]
MKKGIASSVSLLGISLILFGCSNSTNSKEKDTASKTTQTEKKASSKKSSSIKVPSQDIAMLQEGDGEEYQVKQFKKYVNQLKNKYTKKSDGLHEKYVKEEPTYPKKGQWTSKNDQGVIMTYLADMKNISDQNINGLKLFNTQYWTAGFDSASQEMIDNLGSGSMDETRPVFNKEGDEFVANDAVIFTVVETDFKNTSDQTLTYDGLTGYAGGEYDFSTPDGKQINRDDIFYSDDTADQEVQAGNTVEDKDLIIVLATGRTLKEAYNKINQNTLTIHPAGVSNEDQDQYTDGMLNHIDLKVK